VHSSLLVDVLRTLNLVRARSGRFKACIYFHLYNLGGRLHTTRSENVGFKRRASGRAVNKRVLLLLLAAPCLAFAEDDGDELLGLMQRRATSEVALAHIDDVRTRWDGSVFCIAKSNPDAPADPRAAAFAAVRTYLENNPAERYRPRRYLIIQGLREAYPCAPR